MDRTSNIFCGDIGGTKTRLALFDPARVSAPIVEISYPSRDYDSFLEILSDFRSLHPQPIACAAFGIAGPVFGTSCKATNLPWQIDANQIEQRFSIPYVHLLNDLEATAYGIPALHEDELYTLQQGSIDSGGNRAVIAAGTGLGQAGIFWDGSRHIPFATEGGHCDFAPGDDLEYGLLTALRLGKRSTSWEDVLSGPGLVSIYRFLSDRDKRQGPEWLDNYQYPDLAAETITRRATDDQDPICIEALEIFVRLYGAEAGNLALKMMATGGVYLGGGIAPRILPWLKQPRFLEAFCKKGKMYGLLKTIPVHIILNDRAALYGPALYLAEKVLPTA